MTKIDPWAALYERPRPLTLDWGHYRIYAPSAYRVVRSLALVPIVHTEALDLARLFPTCWAMTGNGPTLCVLRTLLDDGAGFPGGSKAALSALPLAFAAYPLVVPHSEEGLSQRMIVDEGIADHPTDIGAPLLMDDGRLSRAVGARARKALQAGQALPTTRALTKHLFEAELLEPWPLRFDLGHSEKVDISHLMVIAKSRLDDVRVHSAINAFGMEAGLFLSAHRLSLFKIASLLSAAKAAVAARASASEPGVEAA